MGRRLLIRRPLQTLGASTAARSLTVSAVVADMCGFAIWKLRPWRRLPTSSASSDEGADRKAPGWTTKASQQVALILATFDAQELVPERLKA